MKDNRKKYNKIIIFSIFDLLVSLNGSCCVSKDAPIIHSIYFALRMKFVRCSLVLRKRLSGAEATAIQVYRISEEDEHEAEIIIATERARILAEEALE